VDDLATAAEVSIDFVALKKRLSLGPQIVGGPVDVAVITKGDGFVWFKHK